MSCYCWILFIEIALSITYLETDELRDSFLIFPISAETNGTERGTTEFCFLTLTSSCSILPKINQKKSKKCYQANIVHFMAETYHGEKNICHLKRNKYQIPRYQIPSSHTTRGE